MERPARLNKNIAIAIIVLFHAVGLFGLMMPAFQSSFLRIVPFHLLLMLVVIVLSHDSPNAKFISFALVVYLLGFIAEWIGVHKNWIFGNYNYGETLGIKLWDIPLTIGLNWFMLVYAAGVTMQYSTIRNKWLRIILGSIILVLLDFLIEPVAMRFDYWQWVDHIVPVKNYLGWFAVGALMLFLFEQYKFKKQSWVASLLLAIQFLFFLILANTDVAM